MKNKLFHIFFILFLLSLISCASTNSIKKFSYDNKRLKNVIKTEYAGYDEMVERGFNLNELDYVSSKEDFMDVYLKYYYDEDGYPLDNHIWISDVSAYNKTTTTIFYNEYGSKEELKEKGYEENKTMFYYPSNDEKKWRTGRIGLNIGKKTWVSTGENYEYYETLKSIYYRLPSFSGKMGDIPFIDGTKEKENIIFDLRSNSGGHLTWANNFFKKLGKYDGKILILYDNCSASAAECFYFLAKCNPDYVYNVQNEQINFTITNYDIYLIGTNTAGCAKYGFEGMDGQPCDFYFKNMDLKLSLPDAKAFERITKHDYDYGKSFKEGQGLIPDAWAVTTEEFIKTIQFYTDDKEINKLY